MSARTGPSTLAELALGAIGAQLSNAASDAERPLESSFLSERAAALPDDPSRWRPLLERRIADPHPGDERLGALSGPLQLKMTEVLAVALALAVERDPAVGRALAFLQHPVGGSRPTFGLLGATLGFAVEAGAARALDELMTGPALASGLLLPGGVDAPLPERWLRVPEPLVLALQGLPVARPGCRLERPADAIPLGPSLEAEAKRQARGLARGEGRVLVVRSPSLREGRAIAVRLARALERRAVFVEPSDDVRGLVPWLLLDRLLPVFERELGPGERWRLPPLPGHTGPVVVLLGPEGGVETELGTPIAWRVPRPPVEERVLLWQASLGQPELAEALARAHRQGCARIDELGRLAGQRAAVEGRDAPLAEDVVEAAWSSDASGLDAFAEPMVARVAEDSLVLSHQLRAELELLFLRCRHREALAEGLGPSTRTRYRPGVRCLLVGPSGTGKTLAAAWLATRLALPLYRVDLASVVSKYIGETEKNLAQLFARAEEAEVVLLFDEADSLFGKRTEVKQSNDRFANAQTNYVLQRIESFDGIAVLTSNSRSRFDAAFTRRLDFIIEFPLPVPEERRALWRAHLGEGHELSSHQVNGLAATVDLAGGHIRNIVLSAATLARAEQRAVRFEDIERGLEVEYRKLGQQPPKLKDERAWMRSPVGAAAALRHGGRTAR